MACYARGPLSARSGREFWRAALGWICPSADLRRPVSNWLGGKPPFATSVARPILIKTGFGPFAEQADEQGVLISREFNGNAP